MNKDFIAENLTAENDALVFGGANVSALAQKYGTPLYLMDEDRIRARCKEYLTALQAEFGRSCKVLYASKACSFKQIYRIIKEEGLGADVVSCGEIYTCKAAGFDLGNAFFHSNNKTDEDIAYAIEAGIGYFVIDGEEELLAISRIAKEKGATQKVLLRITPGIDPHTYAAVATGKVDSKFGCPIETGKAEAVIKLALSTPSVTLVGLHCHVGSQVFEPDVYLQTVQIMTAFMAQMYQKYAYVTEILDLGGGFGVRYTASDPALKIAENVRIVARAVKEECAALGLSLPTLCLEPGRSIVADSGITVYTVGAVKKIEGYKNYVSVDGGMTDNPRFALYGSSYTVLPVNNLSAPRDMVCSVVGRCCESGDILQENVPLPASVKRGDKICVLTTGAYNYSMASNYNRLPRPPVVMVKGGTDYLAVKRETLQDLVQNDL